MPVTYQIDKASNIIRTKCIGLVTIEEVIDHFRVLAQDPDCPDYLDVLLDLSEATTIPTKENLREVSRVISSVEGTVQFGICAIVACTDVLYGMLRMFEVFAEKGFRETRVFRTTEGAEAWLASRRATAGEGSRHSSMI
jgi:hypothetical protein